MGVRWGWFYLLQCRIYVCCCCLAAGGSWGCSWLIVCRMVGEEIFKGRRRTNNRLAIGAGFFGAAGVRLLLRYSCGYGELI